jgi:hypothetical protein
MSIIRAKQEICLNIATIRCLSSYVSGRYCLRFCLSEINTNLEQSENITYGHYQNKYAIPVSVIEYKNNIIPPTMVNKIYEPAKSNSQMLYDTS